MKAGPIRRRVRLRTMQKRCPDPCDAITYGAQAHPTQTDFSAASVNARAIKVNAANPAMVAEMNFMFGVSLAHRTMPGDDFAPQLRCASQMCAHDLFGTGLNRFNRYSVRKTESDVGNFRLAHR